MLQEWEDIMTESDISTVVGRDLLLQILLVVIGLVVSRL